MPAHGSVLPGSLPPCFALFHNYTTNEEAKSCLSASSSLLEQPGGSEVGRQERIRLWALWVLGTFQSSHAAAEGFSSFAGHPVLRGQQAAVVSAGRHVGRVADTWPEAVPLAAAAARVQYATLHLITAT